MKLFNYDGDFNFSINTNEVLLIKEFKELIDIKRNKCKEDKTGKKRLIAMKEFQYIYLTMDWNSPYREYTRRERDVAALEDTGLDTASHLIEACKKYRSIQETRTLKLLTSAYEGIDKLRQYFEDVDLSERDPDTGKPLYSARDIVSNVSNLGKVVDGLSSLEDRVRREQEKKTDLRGDVELGLFD